MSCTHTTYHSRGHSSHGGRHKTAITDSLLEAAAARNASGDKQGAISLIDSTLSMRPADTFNTCLRDVLIHFAGTEMNLKTKVLILLVARNPNSRVFNLCIIAL